MTTDEILERKCECDPNANFRCPICRVVRTEVLMLRVRVHVLEEEVARLQAKVMGPW